MLREVMTGVAAGAVGTSVLNIVTYADMALRGRPASSSTSQLVGTVGDKLGVESLGSQSAGDDSTAENRRSGLGSLSGYVVGLGVGGIYGLVGDQLRSVPLGAKAVALGAIAMAASDTPLATLGINDPRTWGAADWASDVVPHLAYGLFTALAYDSFGRD